MASAIGGWARRSNELNNRARVTLATVSVLQVRRSSQSLLSAQRALEAANAGLEDTVAERTAELRE